MFEGIKERLGFGGNNGYDDVYDDVDERYDERFDDFDDYSDNEEYTGYAPVTTRDAGAQRGYSDEYSPVNYSPARTMSHPRLVSLDDVRASTQIPESLNRDPLPPRRASAGRASDYTASRNDGASASFAGAAADQAPARFGGYESGFDATADRSPEKPASEVGVSVHVPITERPLVSDSYDPQRMLERSQTQSLLRTPTRRVTVLTPMSYDEVENVARMLRAGDVVVLSLRQTPSQLSKRVLDFSFGVASALDATVEGVGEKVFAITKGQQMADDERARLRAQGIL